MDRSRVVLPPLPLILALIGLRMLLFLNFLWKPWSATALALATIMFFWWSGIILRSFIDSYVVESRMPEWGTARLLVRLAKGLACRIVLAVWIEESDGEFLSDGSKLCEGIGLMPGLLPCKPRLELLNGTFLLITPSASKSCIKS